MKGKLLCRVWLLDFWQTEKIEAWLADMAQKGWHLVRSGYVFAVFAKGEPEKVRYRCDVFPPDQDLPERLEVYRQAGWDHVLRFYSLHIFRAPDDAQIPELHTDPREQAPAMARLLHPLYWATGLALFLMVLYTAVPALMLDHFLLLYADIPYLAGLLFMLFLVGGCCL